jgi:acid stress-induced BolA-like protein IbaG/YrbA
MNLIEEVTSKLGKTFNDASDKISLIDERGDGHHYLLTIHSNKFADKSRLEKRRMVYSLLEDYLETGKIHALKMKLITLDNA